MQFKNFCIENLVKFLANLTINLDRKQSVNTNIYMSNGFNFWFKNGHWHFSAFNLKAQSEEKLNRKVLTFMVEYKSIN